LHIGFISCLLNVLVFAHVREMSNEKRGYINY
jgi:hypothetical protein